MVGIAGPGVGPALRISAIIESLYCGRYSHNSSRRPAAATAARLMVTVLLE